ncbi:hypothetical protein AA309_18495 [Microvirga vignae]|uniref:Uncharacterized protein n=1 Tax=Microvirga vignae TaxID=1225564 RepID=A0A0H1R933_9HYPH|nr:hypothetical protein AA309_18495 [Microvirga vignae]
MLLPRRGGGLTEEALCEVMPRNPYQNRWANRRGHLRVDQKILTVTAPYGRKSAEIAQRVAHETLAHQSLQELVQQERVCKGSTL